MRRRFVSIWFRHLKTDWFSLCQRVNARHSDNANKDLRKVPFVLRTPVHGRMIITATNQVAEMRGVSNGMVLADARAIVPDLEVLDDKPDVPEQLLKRLGEWCIRFSPVVAIDPPDGLILDSTGCSHLWGGDSLYTEYIKQRLNKRGYDVRVAMADTIGVAWGVARFANEPLVIPPDCHTEALLDLPPEGLRLEEAVVDRLHKLGLHQVRQFITIPRSSLRRRFGQQFIMRLDTALGNELETLHPIVPVEPYEERLPSLEPIITATGVEIALNQLLETLCQKLQHDQKGLRQAVFTCYRVDGKITETGISTSRPSHSARHLFKLFEINLQSIDPGLGIELFILKAPVVENHLPCQEKMWEGSAGLKDMRLAELIDRLTVKVGPQAVSRYLPDEHYWPERSFRKASSLEENLALEWSKDKLRPLHLLSRPERIEVSAPIPDYPPMLFRYKGKVHNIVKADGPERIEREWWLEQGQHRDYYRVEDEEGQRYWLFRAGHYDDSNYQWYLHGFLP